jgi:glycosyltransferase involved in cell wall biosynthesis
LKNIISISVIIPVFNSEKTLKVLHDQIVYVLSKMTNQYEIIFVNDGSIDGSWKEIKKLSENNIFVLGINLIKNYGQHNALLCGVRAAKNEIIVTMDDDLQHPPEEISKMIDKLNEGYDVIYGSPENEKHGLFRNFASVFTKIALKTTMGVKIGRYVSAFRVFRTELRDVFQHYHGSYVSIDVLLAWGTSRFAAIPIRHDIRKHGKSNYTFRRLFVIALNMITGFSIIPLQIASILGFVFAFFGLLVLIYVITNFFIYGSPVQGFSFLASIISIFSGVQLLAIGIIGEYLARMHFRSMNKPQYIESYKVRD